MTDPTSPPPDPWPPVPDDPAWAVRERQKHVARSLGRHADPYPRPARRQPPPDPRYGSPEGVTGTDRTPSGVIRLSPGWSWSSIDGRLEIVPDWPATSPRIWPAVVAALLVGAVAGALLTSAWWLW